MSRFLGFSSLGLAALALVVALVGAQDPIVVPPPPAEASSGASPAELQALEKRVQALEGTVQLLSQRLMAFEKQPGTAAGGAVAVPAGALAAEVEQLKSEIRGLMAGEALNSEGGREYLKEMMRSVQGEMREAERQEREQRWVQAMAQVQSERDERWRQFVSEAKLDYRQEQELTRRLQGEDTRRKALLDEVRAGSKSPRDMQRELRATRRETDQEMQKLLSEDQQAKYEELRREEWRQSRQQGPRGEQGGGRQRNAAP